MKITDNVANRIVDAAHRFKRIRAQFELFCKSLEFFAEPNCNIPGVTVAKTDDPAFCTVSFETVSVGLRFLQTFNSTGTASGRVVATLERPRFTASPALLGAVAFDWRGTTDFEFEEGAGFLDIETHAAVIVLHFVHIALERSAD